jgi:hypothetical protein
MKLSIQKAISIGIIFLISWYLVICCVSYAHQRPLWNDEAAVFLSVDQLEPIDFFTRELVGGQIFPRAYLFSIQQISRPFNLSLLSLRFLSFVFMLSAFFCWMHIISQEFKNRFHYLTYILAWCASAALIFYSAELKQYSMDVLSSGLFMLFLYYQPNLEKEGNRRKYNCLLALLPALIFFSYTSFFFFIFPLYNLFLSQKDNKSLRSSMATYVVSLAVCSIVVYLFDMRLRTVHGYNDYFIYLTSFGDFFKTWGEGTSNLFARCLVERPRIVKKIVLGFFVFGVINMFVSFFSNIKKENYRMHSIKVIALVVYLELFIMGCLKKYPFSVPRTSLFFSPMVLFLTIDGIALTKKIHPLLYKVVFTAFFLLLLFIAVQVGWLFAHGEIWSMPKIWWFGVE